MIYAALYDVSVLSIGTLTLTTAGKSDVVITLTALGSVSGANGTIFTHGVAPSTFVSQGQRGSTKFQEMADLSAAAALQVAIRAEMTTQSWVTPTNCTVTWSKTTGKFTVAYSSANFTMAWSLAAGRNWMGFSASQSGAQTYTSDQVPTYVIDPTMSKVSDDSTNYEPDGIASLAIADDGAGFGIARYESPVYRDWLQQYESKAKTLRLSAASSHPWTFQDLFEHCRTVFPFMTVDAFNDDSYYEAFRFRDDGSRFKPERAGMGNDTQFHVSFKCIVEGRVAE